MTRYRTVFALTAILAMAASCQSLFEGEGKTPATPTPIPTPIIPDSPVYVVQKGEVIRQLEFSARVSPVEEAELYFRTDGHVRSVFVQRNDLVETGDLLAELEIADLQKAMAQAQVTLDTAGLRLDEAENELRRATTQAELNLSSAQIRLSEAEQQHESSLISAALTRDIAEAQLAKLHTNQAGLIAEELAARIAVSRAEMALADAQREYQEAVDRSWEPAEVVEAYERALQDAQWNFDLAAAGHNQTIAAQQAHLSDITIQELVLQQRQQELDFFERVIDPLLAIDVERAQQELDRLSAGVDPVLLSEVSQARLALERLQAQVADGQITAAIDGRILSVSLSPGRAVTAFEPVITVADPESAELSANLLDVQLKELEQGMFIAVGFGAYPGESWQGVVRRLPYPYGTGGGSQTLEGEDRSTRITMLDSPDDLELGDLARVLVILEEKKDALWLPPEAIRSFQGRKFVVVQEGDRQRRVDIQVGIESQNRVEIVEGLDEGAIIVGQ